MSYYIGNFTLASAPVLLLPELSIETGLLAGSHLATILALQDEDMGETSDTHQSQFDGQPRRRRKEIKLDCEGYARNWAKIMCRDKGGVKAGSVSCSVGRNRNGVLGCKECTAECIDGQPVDPLQPVGPTNGIPEIPR